LLCHPIPAKIAFTGSTEVGKTILRSLAGTDKKLTLELGGKAANIVFDDAPLDQAVEGIVNGIFFNQGHVCCAGSRLLVHEPVAAAVLAKLKRRIRLLRVGDPLDKNTDIGAINSRAQLEKIRELVRSGVKEGAELYQPPGRLPARGFFFPPTLFSAVTMSHRIAREEIFGPVLSILTFRTVDEAIEKANNTAYGLSAGVWTDKGSRILKLATELKAGVVWANTYNKFDPASPFGGYKESGFGREGGRQGLWDYLKFEPMKFFMWKAGNREKRPRPQPERLNRSGPRNTLNTRIKRLTRRRAGEPISPKDYGSFFRDEAPFPFFSVCSVCSVGNSLHGSG